ncbi:DUF3565 domain-containing protein [Pseudomonas typographi]|uniref:DUF3565 domain-containing protein n=1 Tax=Pseudomonas typographi TaxID=2715964 RepID=UPI001EED3197|nr:DUF3565 domain-containing protein [Pseudomonas typographi]
MHEYVESTSVNKPSGDCEPQRRTLITGFAQDEHGHWFARLSCGHTQHLRHDPPWQQRAWVIDPEERARRIGQAFTCGWCRRGTVGDTLAP